MKSALVLFLLFLGGCKITDKDIFGKYVLQNFSKTTLLIKEDGTFTFTQNYANPYLHPFPHPEENYFRTLGNWDFVGNEIKLIGTSDTLIYKNVQLVSTELSINELSNFKFVDEDLDIVPILGVEFTDSTWMYTMHSSMKEFDFDLLQRDTLQFHFFGYEPFTFIQGEQLNKNYIFKLLPAFVPNEIDSMSLRVKRNVLGSRKFKFNKSNLE